MNKPFLYSKLAVKNFLKRPSLTQAWMLVKYYSAWKRNAEPGRSPIADAQPWICFGAIDFLEQKANAQMTLFEYGSGGSTLFWALRVAKVYSIEHDEDWYQQMLKELADRNIKNTQYIAAFPETDSSFESKDFRRPQDCISKSRKYVNMKFDTYVKTIESFPDSSFDIIVVDGRARNSCIYYSVPKLKTGGLLVVDNTEREYYLKPFEFKKEEWTKWVFSGPVPYSYSFSETTIFQKK